MNDIESSKYMVKMDDLLKENDYLKNQLIQNDIYIKKLVMNLNKQFQIVEKLNKEIEIYEINKNKENLILRQKILDLELELNRLKKNGISDNNVESDQYDNNSNSMTVFVNKIMMKLRGDNENLIKENIDLNKKIFDMNLSLTKLDGEFKMEREKMAMQVEKHEFEIQRWKKKLNFYKQKNNQNAEINNDILQDVKENDLNELFEQIFKNESVNHAIDEHDSKKSKKKKSKSNLKISV
jgi:hypothetical protein